MTARFTQLLKERLPEALIQKLEGMGLPAAFTAAPRLAGRDAVAGSEALGLPGGRPWQTDELVRLWLLLRVPEAESFAAIDPLFRGAAVSEAVLLYASLPLLPRPEAWKARCAEGIRSNVAPVLEALMYENPYPARYLDEAAWNTLVLKAFFTEKEVDRIVGLHERANPRLSRMLEDYARERKAAGRPVPKGLEALAAAGAAR